MYPIRNFQEPLIFYSYYFIYVIYGNLTMKSTLILHPNNRFTILFYGCEGYSTIKVAEDY